ncbi:MAG TPA: stage II sporulation protein P [Desulfosporosinus sp.]|nr:stage II sporulation protein P [Desulfosporosinus sp.]
MLRDDFYYRRPKKNFRLRKVREWTRVLLLGFVSFLVIWGFVFALRSGSSGQLVGFLNQQSFPFQAILLEGVPGYSQPQRPLLDLKRNQGAAIGMFLLTGVNISDPRTFFLGYFSPPVQGPVWLGWAYNPNDPEFEGPILEPIETPKTTDIPAAPVTPGAEGIIVGIYNTHNNESYAGDGGPEHRFGENGDVVTVADTLKEALEKNGIGAVNSKQIHDSVEFMKAYSYSITTATQMTKDYPNMKLLIDVHRDGFPAGVAKRTATVKGKTVSRVMIVIGKKNPHWQTNDALAKKLMALAETKYPGLFMPNISYAEDARYNEHLSDGGLLLEFGSQFNTLEESNGASEAVAEILTDYLKQVK